MGQERLKRESDAFLLCRVGVRLCALPIEHVVETMRPLPTSALRGAPAFVAGVAIVRGQPVPVLDVSRLLESVASVSPPERFVTVRVGTRCVVLSFDAVLGVRLLDEAAPTDAMPPLLREVGAGVVSAIRALDAELLVVLESARAVPDAVWSALDASPRAS
jgi:purine-binding chemotaxis protein CheW